MNKNVSKTLKEDDFNQFNQNSPQKSNNIILGNEKNPSFSISEIKKKNENVNRNNLIPKSKDFIELKSSKKGEAIDSNSGSKQLKHKEQPIDIKYTEEYLELEYKFNQVNEQKKLLENEIKYIKQEKFEMESFIQEITERQTELLEENNAYRELFSKYQQEPEREDTPKFNSEIPSEKRYSQQHFNSMKEKDDIIRSCMDEKKLILEQFNELKENCQSMKDNARVILNVLEGFEKSNGLPNDITTRMQIENRLKLILGMGTINNDKRGSKSFIKSKNASLKDSQKGLTPKVKDIRVSSKPIRFIKPMDSH